MKKDLTWKKGEKLLPSNHPLYLFFHPYVIHLSFLPLFPSAIIC